MGNNITHNIVENSNKSEDNIAMIRNDGKGEASKVSVINAGDDIVTNVRHNTNNKLTIPFHLPIIISVTASSIVTHMVINDMFIFSINFRPFF